MRLYEFKDALSVYDCDIDVGSEYIHVKHTTDDEPVAHIAKGRVCYVNTNYTRFEMFCDTRKIEVFKLLTEFAATPIKDRASNYEVITTNVPPILSRKLIVRKSDKDSVSFVHILERFDDSIWKSVFNDYTDKPPIWVSVGIANGSFEKSYIDWD